jgi:hypothetical protein
MTTKEILQKAKKITIAHGYGDGTYLYDVLVEDGVCVIRQHPDVVNKFINHKVNRG